MSLSRLNALPSSCGEASEVQAAAHGARNCLVQCNGGALDTLLFTRHGRLPCKL